MEALYGGSGAIKPVIWPNAVQLCVIHTDVNALQQLCMASRLAVAEGFNLMTTCCDWPWKILHAQCALGSKSIMDILAGTKGTAVLTHFLTGQSIASCGWQRNVCLTPTVLVGSNRYDQYGEPSPIT